MPAEDDDLATSAPPATIILGRRPDAPVGSSPWEIIVGPDVLPAAALSAWQAMEGNPPEDFAEVCRFDLHCPHARIFPRANPALKNAAAYIAEVADQIPAARARSLEADGAFAQAVKNKITEPDDKRAHAAKRAADLRAAEAKKSLRRLELELDRRRSVVAGQALPEKTLDGEGR